MFFPHVFLCNNDTSLQVPQTGPGADWAVHFGKDKDWYYFSSLNCTLIETSQNGTSDDSILTPYEISCADPMEHDAHVYINEYTRAVR